MPVSHDDVMAKLAPERQERIRARALELLAEEEMTLRDLRVVQNLTQARVAEALGIEQDSVSRMERRPDMLVSTMSEYVEAMGGRLRIVAEFPNRRPYSVKLVERANSQKTERSGRSTASKSTP